MSRFLLLLPATLLIALASAKAQIAAPSLLPTFVPENPAVLQWGASSRIGAGWIDADSEITDDSTVPATLSNGESSGFLAGLRLHGENISFAAQVAELDGSEGTEVTTEVSFSGAAIAIPIGDFLTLGIGQENVEIVATFDNGALRAERTLEATTPLAGLSLKLGVLYLGAAIGKETATASQTTVPVIPVFTFDVEWERDVTRFGAALYSTEGTQWHLEAGVMKRNSTTTTDAATGIVLPIAESKESFAVIEFNAGGFLLGLKAKDLEESDQSVTPATVNVTEDTREINLGWVPEEGWAFVLIASTVKREEPVTLKTTETQTVAALLTFLF